VESMQQANLRFERPVAPAEPSNVAGAAGSVSVAITISRILGLVREMVLARCFGAGLYTDAFNVAYRIPNLLRDLFAEGALSSAFIPTFVRTIVHGGRKQAWLLANRLICALLVILGVVTLIFFFGAKVLVYLMAAGFSSIPEKLALTTQMAKIMSPFLLCVSLAAVGMGALNACGSFFVPAMASSAFNVCCILAGIFLSPFMPRYGLEPVVSMAIGALVGGGSQFVIMIPKAYAHGFRFRFTLDFDDPGLRHIARLMLPAIIGLSATQINITVDYQLASLLGNGPVSWLNYGFRLMQLPVGVFGIAIATASVAKVSRLAAEDESERLYASLHSSLRLAACLTFPASVGLILFRGEIVRLLYERGSFLPGDTWKTSQVVLVYSFALFAYSGVKILVPAFYALNDTRTPVRISYVTVGAKIGLNLLLILPMGFLGLALATTIASWLNMGLLMRRIKRHAGTAFCREELAVYLRIVMASLAMGFLALAVFRFSGVVWPGSTHLILAIRLTIAIAVALGSLIPFLRLLKVEEGREITHMIRMMIKRSR
jgi:putative peptidoglycan lipid II flippase